MDDVVAWHWEKLGCFSVRSAYRLGVDVRDLDSNLCSSSNRPDGLRTVWKKLWLLRIPHKIRIFAWKVVHGGLATKSNKKRRHLECSVVCDICGMEDETEFHALVWCKHTTALREAMRATWPIPIERLLMLSGS